MHCVRLRNLQGIGMAVEKEEDRDERETCWGIDSNHVPIVLYIAGFQRNQANDPEYGSGTENSVRGCPLPLGCRKCEVRAGSFLRRDWMQGYDLCEEWRYSCGKVIFAVIRQASSFVGLHEFQPSLCRLYIVEIKK